MFDRSFCPLNFANIHYNSVFFWENKDTRGRYLAPFYLDMQSFEVLSIRV